MSEEAANVLTQDGPELEEVEQVTAEETPNAETEESGEEKPQADAEKGEEAEHKRLGGFKRKVLKAQQEAEFWREEALRNRTKGAEKTAEPDPDKPKRPKLSEFQGTVEEFDKAQEEYEGKLEKWTETKAQQDALTRQIETSVASLTKKVSDLPEWDEMKAAVQEHKMPMRLTNLLVAETAKITNGAETLKALLLDAEEAAQLAEFDKYDDAESIKAQIISMSRALRIAGKKSEPVVEETAPEKPPKPINPVRKVAPSGTDDWMNDPKISTEEWQRRMNARAAKRGQS